MIQPAPRPQFPDLLISSPSSGSYHHSHLLHLWNQTHEAYYPTSSISSLLIHLFPVYQLLNSLSTSNQTLQFSYPLGLSSCLHFPLPQLSSSNVPSLYPILFLVYGMQCPTLVPCIRKLQALKHLYDILCFPLVPGTSQREQLFLGRMPRAWTRALMGFNSYFFSLTLYPHMGITRCHKEP